MLQFPMQKRTRVLFNTAGIQVIDQTPPTRLTNSAILYINQLALLLRRCLSGI
jgi:hypothetical protein